MSIDVEAHCNAPLLIILMCATECIIKIYTDGIYRRKMR